MTSPPMVRVTVPDAASKLFVPVMGYVVVKEIRTHDPVRRHGSGQPVYAPLSAHLLHLL